MEELNLGITCYMLNHSEYNQGLHRVMAMGDFMTMQIRIRSAYGYKYALEKCPLSLYVLSCYDVF